MMRYTMVAWCGGALPCTANSDLGLPGWANYLRTGGLGELTYPVPHSGMWTPPGAPIHHMYILAERRDTTKLAERYRSSLCSNQSLDRRIASCVPPHTRPVWNVLSHLKTIIYVYFGPECYSTREAANIWSKPTDIVMYLLHITTLCNVNVLHVLYLKLKRTTTTTYTYVDIYTLVGKSLTRVIHTTSLYPADVNAHPCFLFLWAIRYGAFHYFTRN